MRNFVNSASSSRFKPAMLLPNSKAHKLTAAINPSIKAAANQLNGHSK